VIKEEKIFKYMRGKKCLIIGNGNSDAEPSDYDCVIRFGVGLNGGPCDIWVANFMTRGGCYIENGMFYRTNRGHSAKIPIALFPFEYIVRLSQDQTEYPKEWHSVTHFVDKNTNNEIRNGLYHQPLTGTMFLKWLFIRGPKLDLYLTGFDGFKSDNIYHNLGPARPHRLIKDQEALRVWTEEGRFQLV